mmetsp:Transcript_25543/g.33256  ORF Transcript_25543/g.33256 Transcript_25543/m.33256 type:complete len:332 (-) Transcript_25543:195-1190(-)
MVQIGLTMLTSKLLNNSQMVGLVSFARLSVSRVNVRGLSSLPPNLKLADEDILDPVYNFPGESKMRHQKAPLDMPKSVRDSATSVFQRSGLMEPTIDIPVSHFSSKPDDDPNDPPPPPEMMKLDSKVFGLPLRLDILQTVVKWQLACRRAGTGSSKRIGDVSGSGRKSHPQKGTGRARAGHRRPPHWRGGAKAHGPPTGGRDWSYTINKKERRLGLCTALSQKVAEGNLMVVDGFHQGSHRTALLNKKLISCGWENVLMIAPVGEPEDEEGTARFMMAVKNLPRAHVLPSSGANVYDLLKREKVVMSRAAVEELQKRLLTPIRRKPWEKLE